MVWIDHIGSNNAMDTSICHTPLTHMHVGLIPQLMLGTHMHVCDRGVVGV